MTRGTPSLDVGDELLHQFADVPPIVILDAALATVATVVWEEHRPFAPPRSDPDKNILKFPLDTNRNLQYSNHRLRYDARRETSIPPGSGGHHPRPRPRIVASGNGAHDPEGSRKIHQPELSLAD